MPNNPTDFRPPVVKAYLRDPDSDEVPQQDATPTDDEEEEKVSECEEVADAPTPHIFVSAKEEHEFQLDIELRKQGIITTPGEAFEASDMAEIESLLARDFLHWTIL
ncbi:hypothetical protein E4U23_006215 [Claviceps purpurea]|nr:hypothetical protein E4U51_007289 [Claviceps purpurea]KAG6244404.1 hypothetical protein E4U23_006215 [Claviceps purpurea]